MVFVNVLTQRIWSGSGLTTGVGKTVIEVKTVSPKQPLYSGSTVIVAISILLVLFVVVKEWMVSIPEIGDNPIVLFPVDQL